MSTRSGPSTRSALSDLSSLTPSTRSRSSLRAKAIEAETIEAVAQGPEKPVVVKLPDVAEVVEAPVVEGADGADGADVADVADGADGADGADVAEATEASDSSDTSDVSHASPTPQVGKSLTALLDEIWQGLEEKLLSPKPSTPGSVTARRTLKRVTVTADQTPGYILLDPHAGAVNYYQAPTPAEPEGGAPIPVGIPAGFTARMVATVPPSDDQPIPSLILLDEMQILETKFDPEHQHFTKVRSIYRTRPGETIVVGAEGKVLGAEGKVLGGHAGLPTPGLVFQVTHTHTQGTDNEISVHLLRSTTKHGRPTWRETEVARFPTSELSVEALDSVDGLWATYITSDDRLVGVAITGHGHDHGHTHSHTHTHSG